MRPPGAILPGTDEPPDLVGTVRIGTWRKWLAEAEDPRFWITGGCFWWSRHTLARRAAPGSRLYIVHDRRLRLYVTLGVPRPQPPREWTPLIVPACPSGETGIVPVTLDAGIRGFRGLRRRWWPYEAEIPCPDWRGAALGLEEEEAA